MTWGILSLLCVYNAVILTSDPAISSRTAARAAAEPHTRDSAHQQPGEPPDRDEPPCLLLDEVERRQEARGRRDQTRDRHRPGQLAGAQPGQRERAGQNPEANAVNRAAGREGSSGQPRGVLVVLPPAAAERQGAQPRGRKRCGGEPSAGERRGTEPPRSLPRPRGQPRNRDGEPGQRSGRDQLACGAEPGRARILSEVAPDLRWLRAGTRVRGVGRATAPPTPAMKLTPVSRPVIAPGSRNEVSVFLLVASVWMTPRLPNMCFLLVIGDGWSGTKPCRF